MISDRMTSFDDIGTVQPFHSQLSRFTSNNTNFNLDSTFSSHPNFYAQNISDYAGANNTGLMNQQNDKTIDTASFATESKESSLAPIGVAETVEPTLASDLTSNLPALESTSLLGIAGATAIDKLTDAQNQSNLDQAKIGQGEFGNSLMHIQDAQNQADHNSNFRTLEGASVGLGSAFGAEGLMAGAGIAAVLEGINQLTDPGQVSVTGTNNVQVPS